MTFTGNRHESNSLCAGGSGERANGLGRDFWCYQTGQMISIIGDVCGSIALAWWILDATGSAAMISTVLAPAILTQIVLTPLLGPLGDRFSRKRLIIIADGLRGAMMAALTLLAWSGAFPLYAVIGIYLAFAAGTALFNSNSLSIVPQLVSQDKLPTAVRMSQSLAAIGGVLGGIAGGVLVTFMGVGPALLADAASFGVAALATAAILGSMAGAPVAAPGGDAAPKSFLRELRGGFRVIARIPVLFWLCVAIALFNLVLSPMQVLLPAYAKQAKAMPAWFLGGLEAGMGLGIILGALLIGVLERLPRLAAGVVVLGLFLVGAGTAVLPHLPGVVFPLLLMLLLGVGVAWTNIPIETRISVAMPDRFRARVSSIIVFLASGTSPLGIAAGGVLAAWVGVRDVMTGLGVVVLLLLPALFRIPGFSGFFRRPSAELADHFAKAHPDAFEEGS